MNPTAYLLGSAGLKVFPVSAKKRPTVKGWQNPLAVHEYQWPTENVGVNVPDGVFIIDLDVYKGVRRSDVEAALQCVLPWDDALIQTTQSGGEHYAFSVPYGAPMLQGSDLLGVRGFDSRASGRGFFVTGARYTPSPRGVAAIADPARLPALPAEALIALVQQPTEERQRADLPEGDPDVDLWREALRHIDPTDRPTWWAVGCGLHWEFHQRPDEGFALFDAWSAGEFWHDGCPPGYDAETQPQQWESMSPDRSGNGDNVITIASVYQLAVRGGWRPPATVNVADAFGPGAASADTFNGLVARIHEQGSDVRHTVELVEAIAGAGCNALQVNLLAAMLKQALREERLLDKALTAKIDKALNTDAPALPAPAPVFVGEYVPASDIPARRLSRPETSHGDNAESMLREIFGDRLALLHGGLRWWTGREWQAVADETLDTLTFQALRPGKSTSTNVSGTRKALVALSPRLQPPENTGRLVYFQNGVIDLDAPGAAELLPHDPGYVNTGCLTVPYDPTAGCPNWHGFLGSIFGNESDGADRGALLQEIMGYCLFDDLLNTQKAIAFDGVSRAGKGVVLELLATLLGPDRCGSFTFSNLADGKTQSVFRGHPVMMDTEAKPPQRQTSAQAIGFLNKVASNEVVSVQLLNTQTPWSGRLNTKMLIGCNGIPTMIDDSGASSNRFHVLKFTKSFEGREDRGLLRRLLLELPGIAAWAVEGARRLISNGGSFTAPETSIDSSNELRSSNQPLREFIEEMITFDPDGRAHSGDLWRAYRIWAADTNTRLPSRTSFYKSFKQTVLGGDVRYEKALRIGDQVNTGFAGIALTDPATSSQSVVAGAFAGKS